MVFMWVCRNVIETTLIFDGEHTTHKTGEEWGMVYGIAIPTLQKNSGKMVENIGRKHGGNNGDTLLLTNIQIS